MDMTFRRYRRLPTGVLIAVMGVTILMGVSVQGMAFCVGPNGSVAVFSSGTGCHCGVHGHQVGGCTLKEGVSGTNVLPGCSCTDVRFRFGPVVSDTSIRTMFRGPGSRNMGAGACGDSCYLDANRTIVPAQDVAPLDVNLTLFQLQTIVLRI